MATLGTTPSLATATSTRLDSACKHIQQCRVSQDHMAMFAGNDSDELIRNKYRYCVHKDEMVVGITRGLGKDTSMKRFQNSAYPRVVSNLGKMLEPVGDQPSNAVRVLKVLYHHARSLGERRLLLQLLQNGQEADFPVEANIEPYLPVNPDTHRLRCSDSMRCLFDLVPVGYANTQGWAHAHCGDTMSSVMIGGLRTVRNGHFEVMTGDVLQWYWPFERDCFHQDGRRKGRTPLAAGTLVPHGYRFNLQLDPELHGGGHAPLAADFGGDQRRAFRDREYGQAKGVEKAVPMIKPYIPDDEEQAVYDWYRVFARAIAPARAFEELDIMIGRQAL